MLNLLGYRGNDLIEHVLPQGFKPCCIVFRSFALDFIDSLGYYIYYFGT